MSNPNDPIDRRDLIGAAALAAATLAADHVFAADNRVEDRASSLWSRRCPRWQKIYRAHRDVRGGPFMTHTLSGIDVTLCDVAGKVWNTPVYRLLDRGKGFDRFRQASFDVITSRKCSTALDVRGPRQRRGG